MKKQKLTLQQKLERRKYKSPSRFFMWLYHFLSVHFVAKKYNVKINKIDDMKDCKGPCFLVYNHLSRLDHFFFMEAAYPKKISIVAGHNEHFRSHLQLAFKCMHVIPKKNFTSDMSSIKAMSKIIRDGGCVCFSPEGMSSIYGHNQPIVAGTGHFFKHFRVPVYFLNIKGAYLTNHKVCLDERLGEIDCTLSLLFTPEDLDKMTDQDIDKKLNESFRHDDYEWNKEKRIKFNTNGRICTHLHDICYKCPKCGAELSMIGENDYIKCNACGNGAKMNDYYDFIPFDDKCVIPSSPSKWVDWEREQVIKEIRENKEFSFSESVKVGCLPQYHYIKHKKTSEPCGEGIITFDHEGIHFKGEKFGKEWNFELSYKVIYSLVIVTDVTFFSFYVDGEYYDFFPKTPSVGKILLLVEEMHRLHVNTWKNFPWCDYMYENAEKKLN